MSADWSNLTPFMVEGHPPMWISRAAMADPATAQAYIFEDKLYWVEPDPMAWRESPHTSFEFRRTDGSLIDNAAEQFVTSTNDLIARARNLVDLLDDAERNHGSLVGVVTMRARDELRIELLKWQK